MRFKRAYEGAILFFRMGDFYEMFHDDAKTASKVLGLTLTSRAKGDKAIPMAGFPHHAVEPYLQRMIRAGYKVAICEQVQDPAEAKGLVDRDVVRIVTPGTVTEENMLEAKANNYLAAVCANGRQAGIAWVDLSTGSFFVEDVAEGQLSAELARIAPAECLVPEEDSRAETPLVAVLREAIDGMLTSRPDWEFGRDTAYRTLVEHFQTASLDGFGCEDMGLALSSAGALLAYLQETQRASLSHIAKMERFSTSDRVLLDRSTQLSLELVQTMRSGQRTGTLLWVLDHTVTPMGGRLIRAWLTAPLRKKGEVDARLSAVKEIVDQMSLREGLRGSLKRIYDIERIAAKISCGRANGRDLVALKQSLTALPDLEGTLADCRSDMIAGLRDRLDVMDEVRVLIATAIVPDPPMGLRDGGIIREGYDQDLDQVRTIAKSGKSWITNFQAQEIERTGIPSLKVGYNKVFGYYLEVTNAHRDKIPADYTRKQTLKNAERYITPQLKEYESQVLTAEERAKEIEYRIFHEVREQVAAQTQRLQETAGVVAQLDVLGSLATVAVERGYAMPTITEDAELFIRDGRHPVLELTLAGEEFVPNDTDLNTQAGTMMVITGPNMAGKSTYIRQVALIVLMAQMGSFVPAKECRVGLVDRVFTRVGASDELARGQSTFMVEMNEAANILNNATDLSLIILDEVGRGTSTFDGVSIAWAICEFLHEHVKARTLFATHYHELTELALTLSSVRNYNVAVREWEDDVVFLRKIVEGGTDKSYGIHVARLAGLPKGVIERSREILSNLEEAAIDKDNMPAFAAPRRRKAHKKRRNRQLSLFTPAQEVVANELEKLDLEDLTPLDAMNKLSELKRRIEEEKGRTT